MDRDEQLDKAGMPFTLVKSMDANLDEETSKKFLMVTRLVQKTMKVLIVLGPDSPKKELLSAKWLWFFMQQRKKTGRWLTPSRVPVSFGELPVGGGVVVFQSIDLLLPPQQKAVAQVVRDWVMDGRFLILCATSMAVLEEALGRSCVTYLLHSALQVEVKSENPKILKV